MRGSQGAHSWVRERQAAHLATVWHWLDGLDTQRWAGRGGASARCVAEALGAWALARGGPVFCAGVDEIGIEAGLGRNATRRALRALCTGGWCCIETAATATTATVWRLTTPANARERGAAHTPVYGGLDADWTRWGALGKTTALIWRQCVGGVRADTLAAVNGVHIQTVRRHLQRLARHGAAVYDPRTKLWHAHSVGDVAAVYAAHGAQARARASLAAHRAARQAGR